MGCREFRIRYSRSYTPLFNLKMSKIKEHYHEEISCGMAGTDQEYAVTCMKAIADATGKWMYNNMPTEKFLQIVLKEVIDFQNMHDPCQPN